MLPLLLHLKSEKGASILRRVQRWLELPGGAFLPAVPLVLIEFLLRTRWPNGNQNLIADWANVLLYGTLLVYGYLFCSLDRFWEKAVKYRYVAVLAGSTLAVSFFAILLLGLRPPWGHNIGNMLRLGLVGLNKWCWLLVMLGCMRRLAHTNNRFLRYANHAVLPFYMLHQTAIVIIGFFVIKLPIGVAMQYLIINGATFLTVILLYEVLIRRINLLRVLIGMRIAEKRRGSSMHPLSHAWCMRVDCRNHSITVFGIVPLVGYLGRMVDENAGNR